MKVRVRFARVVRQVGVVEMEAANVQEALDCVRLMGREIAKGSSVDLKAVWQVPESPQLELVSGSEV